MKRIALISDTHGYVGEDIFKYLVNCDELWHAGDIGDMQTLEKYETILPAFRGVYGNIDDHRIRAAIPEYQSFEIEGLKVLMTHIGGYPGRYYPGTRSKLEKEHFGLFISGHSHITKIMKDKKYDLVHMNPGSCGHHGFHLIRTLIRFSVENGKIFDVEVVELGRRGKIN
jgi:putative phosphoesterase